MSVRLSPVRASTVPTPYVEVFTSAILWNFQPVVAVTLLTMPSRISGSGSLYLCRPVCSNLRIAKSRADLVKICVVRLCRLHSVVGRNPT